MSNELQVLTAFLERFGSEVEGRQVHELSAGAREKISKLAQGRLAPEERQELLEELRRQPELIARLAEEIKARRPPGR